MKHEVHGVLGDRVMHFDLHDISVRCRISEMQPGADAALSEMFDAALEADDRTCLKMFGPRYFCLTGQHPDITSSMYAYEPSLVHAFESLVVGLSKSVSTIASVGNVPDALRSSAARSGIEIEDFRTATVRFSADQCYALPAHVDALYLECPDEATGASLNEAEFRRVCAWSRERGIVLIVNVASRMFIREGVPDYYGQLSGCKHIVIEDPSCWLPTAGLAFTCMTISLELLNEMNSEWTKRWVPTPLSMAVVLRLARTLSADGSAVAVWRYADQARNLLRGLLNRSVFEVHDSTEVGTQLVSVHSGSLSSGELQRRFASQGVSVGIDKSFTENPDAIVIRVALMRTTSYLANAARQLNFAMGVA